MTSNRKIAANRRNSQRSTGPRSAAGKATASRNAHRHGLAALMAQPVIATEEMKEFVDRLCSTDSCPQLRELALEIARQEWLLGTVRAQQAEVLERLRDPKQQPLSHRAHDLVLAKACSISAWVTDWELKRELPAILHKYRDQMSEEVKAQYEQLRRAQKEQQQQSEASRKSGSSRRKHDKINHDSARPWSIQGENEHWLNDLSEKRIMADPGGLYLGLVPLWLKALMTDCAALDKQQSEDSINRIKRTFERRDDLEALEVAMPDLERLERYECRVWSALKRAYGQFISARSMGS